MQHIVHNNQYIMALVTIFVICIGMLLLKHLKETIIPPKNIKDIFKTIINNGNSIALILLFLFGVYIIDKLCDNPELLSFKKSSITHIKKYKEGFCNSVKSKAKLEEKCNKLSETNCNSVGCCVFLNNEKCVTGDKNGPTFMGTSESPIEAQKYSHKNTCYGADC